MLKFLSSSSSSLARSAATSAAADVSGGSATSAPKNDVPPRRPPLIITSHNVNGLGGRAKNDMDLLCHFMKEYQPDVHCVQECKLQSAPAANGSYNQGKIWDGYRLGKTTPAVAKTYNAVNDLLNRPEFRGYRAVWALSRDPSKRAYAGTAVFYRKDLFDKPLVTRYLEAGDEDKQSEWNDIHGRVLLLEFETMFVLNTYAPNNSTNPDMWARRRAWDARLKHWVAHGTWRSKGKPLVWVGDLNATTDDWDMDDAKYYRDTVYKTSPQWTDPTKDPMLDDRDKGQPGCSINEQLRLKEILREGGLVDAYRSKHPPPVNAMLSWDGSIETAGLGAGGESVAGGKNLCRQKGDYVEAGKEAWTWRGAAGTDVSSAGRYYGRGMRIDYTLISASLVPRVVRAEILGSGYDRHGFLGSDHCPILLELCGEGNGLDATDSSGKKRAAEVSAGILQEGGSSSSNNNSNKRAKMVTSNQRVLGIGTITSHFNS